MNGGTKIPFGLKNGHLVHIDEVPKGLDCGCICPACNSPLVAKKGNKNIHHFSHHNAPECKEAVETTIHLLAKEIIKESEEILLPSAFFYVGANKSPWEISSRKIVKYIDVAIETKIGNIIPDIILFTNEGKLLVEIGVTHFVDSDKTAKIKNIGLSTIEIMLNDFSEIFDKEKLRERILYQTKGKRWIFHETVAAFRKDFLSELSSFIDVRSTLPRNVWYLGGWVSDPNGMVLGCPESSHKPHQSAPYAIPKEDCISCRFNFYSELIHEEGNVYCSKKTNITSYQDYLDWKSDEKCNVN